jgi:Holliday junction resolvasome RuvABC endonuclease subunit
VSGLTVIGVDPSSRKIAAVASTPHDWALFVSEVPEEVAKDRAFTLGVLEAEFSDWLRQFDASKLYIFVEQPLMGRNVHAMRVMSQVEGAVLLAGHKQGAQGVYEVNVQSWKKGVVGKGNAGKQDVNFYIQEHHDGLANLCDGDQDLLDAGAICLYGVATCERGAALTS